MNRASSLCLSPSTAWFIKLPVPPQKDALPVPTDIIMCVRQRHSVDVNSAANRDWNVPLITRSAPSPTNTHGGDSRGWRRREPTQVTRTTSKREARIFAGFKVIYTFCLPLEDPLSYIVPGASGGHWVEFCCFASPSSLLPSGLF